MGDLFFLFFSSQEIIFIIFREKIVLLLVSGSSEKKEMQYFDVCTGTKDDKTRMQAKGNNAPVSVSKPFN